MSDTFKYEPHQWRKLKTIPWSMCHRCGLLWLRNALTEWCVAKGCNNDEHPGYRAAVRQLGGGT